MNARRPSSEADCGPAPLQPLINRRQFLVVGSGCALCSFGGTTRAAKAKWPPVDIGLLKDVARDGISEDFIKHDFFVILHQGSLYAASTVCPHMSNTLGRDPQDATRIVCGGHGSVFDAAGNVVVGPASSGLIRLGITVNDKGQVVVDRNREFPQDKWTDKGSYIEVK